MLPETVNYIFTADINGTIFSYFYSVMYVIQIVVDFLVIFDR